jgi:hypothetical protein
LHAAGLQPTLVSTKLGSLPSATILFLRSFACFWDALLSIAAIFTKHLGRSGGDRQRVKQARRPELEMAQASPVVAGAAAEKQAHYTAPQEAHAGASLSSACQPFSS